jgi:hypothetical protein
MGGGCGKDSFESGIFVGFERPPKGNPGAALNRREPETAYIV